MKIQKNITALSITIAAVIFLFSPLSIIAQTSTAINFPEIISSPIKGAPKLGKPILLMSDTRPLISEGMGWAAPAFWDWNGDGKKDLLIGEFGSGIEHGSCNGNFIRVYENIGKNESPKFADDFYYARMVDDMDARFYWKDNPNKYPVNLIDYGTPISIPQFCCMSFIPQFVDLNNDGFPDLYSGRYSPGEVFWFRGTERGFLPGEKLKQKGDASIYKNNKENYKDPTDWSYWAYSAVSFGDFTGDGLNDMIVGGLAGLRISKNIGTATNPEFGLRELLLDPEGQAICDDKIRDIAIPHVVDWDGDGVLDLLVTSTYFTSKDKAVVFYKGVKVNNEYRFQQGISLFDTKNNTKAFPGGYLNVYVTDWNNDGINDLLLGTKIALVDGDFSPEINWSWDEEYGMLGKLNPGYYSGQKKKDIQEKIERAEKTEAEIGKLEMKKRQEEPVPGNYEKYITKEDIILRHYGGNEAFKSLVHKGYIYLMLGEKK
ncbi:FG-GAP repeat domain-containing protein [Pedobacter nyackensis]|uniref:Repeat domain-containing protein n=1 Tax=Pedobacter nyackensis TaxID=475255 RepID=A0A1W2AK93_9SPHI|nr:VCBS repeat-containing protein [Pedobacter nyackensis]SMC60932.1 Repeat domain-containing protein [Pedobacter nyackensis]